MCNMSDATSDHEGERTGVEKVQYEDIVFERRAHPGPTASPSHMQKEVAFNLEDQEKEASRSPSPVYEIIPEKARARQRVSPTHEAGSKSHTFLRRYRSDQLLSTSLLSLFNRKSSADSMTLPGRSQPLSLAEPMNGAHEIAPVEGEVMNLMDLVRKHAKNFPLRVTVEQGFCSNIEEGGISSDETYNIHFLKYTKVVYLSSSDSPNHMYAVPFNSAVQFGLVYNPHNDLRQALQGKTFESVGDMLSTKPLPKIVRATASYHGANASSSVEENELLVVKSAKRPKVLGSPHLKVYSITTGESKSLPMQCTGHFTTKPHSVCMHLPELVEHIPNLFPAEAVVFVDRTTCNNEFVPESLIGEVVTLMHSSIETTLLATAYSCELEEDEEVKPIHIHGIDIYDIPVNLEIEVKVDLLSVEETQALGAMTVQLYESFDPEKLIVCKPFSSSDSFQTQLQLYRVVHKNRRLEGIQIEKPRMAFADNVWKSKRHTHLPDLQEASETNTENCYKGYSSPPVVPPRLEHHVQDPVPGLAGSKPDPVEYEVPFRRSPLGAQPPSPSGTVDGLEEKRPRGNSSPTQSLPGQSETTNEKETATELTSQTLKDNQTSHTGQVPDNGAATVPKEKQRSECPKKPPKPGTVQKPGKDAREKARVSKQQSFPTESTTKSEGDTRALGNAEDSATGAGRPEDQGSLGGANKLTKPVLPPKPKASPKTNRRATSAKLQRSSHSGSEGGHSIRESTGRTPDGPTVTQELSLTQLLQTCEELRSKLNSLEQANRLSTTEIEALKSEQSKILPLLERAMKQQEAMLSDIQQLKKDLTRMPRRQSGSGGGTIGGQLVSRYSREEERRRAELSKLDCEQVCELLNRMSLQQYIAKFEDEGVDGGLLLECDSEALQQDLGVTSKLHRAKLLRLISGQRSIQDY